MTREQAKAMLPVIQAFAKRKTIQYRNAKGEWKDIEEPSFNVQIEYRIKPE